MTQLTLPGLEAPTSGMDTPMVAAARVTLQALAEGECLEPRHSVLVQLVLSLAGAIDAGVRSGRASAVAMAAAQLRETMIVLDPPPEVGTPDAAAALARFVQELEDHANLVRP